MRPIVKGNEPPSLTRHRQTPHGDFDNYRQRDELREALVEEQRSICCYCMCRIHNDRFMMKIEHWRSRTAHPEEQLHYANLLAACRGGEGQPGKIQHCDTKKGDRDLRWNPADPEHHDHIATRISYQPDGAIVSDDPDVDRDLNQVLNLNLATIRGSRKGVFLGVMRWWRMQRRPVQRGRLEREIERRTAAARAEPYVQVAIWFFEQRLARMMPDAQQGASGTHGTIPTCCSED